jgi:hypothetical protein
VVESESKVRDEGNDGRDAVGQERDQQELGREQDRQGQVAGTDRMSGHPEVREQRKEQEPELRAARQDRHGGEYELGHVYLLHQPAIAGKRVRAGHHRRVEPSPHGQAHEQEGHEALPAALQQGPEDEGVDHQADDRLHDPPQEAQVGSARFLTQLGVRLVGDQLDVMSRGHRLPIQNGAVCYPSG